MNDYSEYLKKPGMMEWIESEWLSKPHHHDSYAKAVNDTIKKFKLKSVIEIGCGTGEVAKRVHATDYLAIDTNEECINVARRKNRDKRFLIYDIRELKLNLNKDLVCAFGVLKHFGLHEWKEIFKKVCSLGDYLIFNMPIAEKTFDDGEEYHHVWMTFERIHVEVVSNGFIIVEQRNDNPIEPIFICKKVETKK